MCVYMRWCSWCSWRFRWSYAAQPDVMWSLPQTLQTASSWHHYTSSKISPSRQPLLRDKTNCKNIPEHTFSYIIQPSFFFRPGVSVQKDDLLVESLIRVLNKSEGKPLPWQQGEKKWAWSYGRGQGTRGVRFGQNHKPKNASSSASR